MSKKAPEWEEIRVRLGDLVPNDQNPKRPTEASSQRLKDSVEQFGQFETVLVNSDGKSLVDGHSRLDSWIVEKGEDYEVRALKPNRKLSDAEVRKIILYSGKGTHGEWDFDMLRESFEEFELVDFGGFDLGIFGNGDDPDKDYDPNDSKEFGEDDLETDHTCPKCGFEF